MKTEEKSLFIYLIYTEDGELVANATAFYQTDAEHDNRVKQLEEYHFNFAAYVWDNNRQLYGITKGALESRWLYPARWMHWHNVPDAIRDRYEEIEEPIV